MELSDLTNPRLISTNIGMPNKPKEDKNDKDEPNHSHKEMEKRWGLILDLKGGTLEMRKKRTKWLPQEPRESLEAYENRLNRTVCYGAFNRTVSTLAGLPFMRPITVEDIPEQLQYIVTDADSTGRDITDLSHSLLKEIIELGITHILVDMPEFPFAEERLPTLQEQIDYKLRPYFTQVSPTNLIAWSTKRVGGLDILSSIKIEEEFYEDDGNGGEKKVEQVRIITSDKIELWREVEDSKSDKEKWYLYKELPNNLGKIPLITIYGNRKGFMKAEPPLEDLAWLNLRHYQKLSDLDNIEHVANVPILFGSGFEEGELDGVEIGPNRLVTATKPEADMKYVEHSGSSIGESRASIKDLEERMASMGADLIIRKSVDRQTATARQIDQSESVSMLQIFVNNLEAGLEKAIKLAGEWLNVEVKNVQVDVGDYLDTPAGANMIDILVEMLLTKGGMSIEEAQLELKRRGVLSDVFKVGKKEIIPTQNNDPNQGVKPDQSSNGEQNQGVKP